ncbi:type I-U CRISPR-associated protein Csb2 [Streptomyces sp. SPB4]|uniref:type I-G CRISPR-associated protein Csb2 n=1 Tax=Streptomyces sp. SPB4 TaxID=2940553 RepID=UPI00247726EC|nr:type I-U CRISPR-associated protein Csb2 [Streptomyces sp. SPB4]MDH6544123.1 CRISPR-associated protein Csb2 [Streptomyces sp. SPB4]
MAFRVDVDLMEPAYQAATLDRVGAEWPPHSYRLFCALVSVADPADPLHDAALEWLEKQPPPTVRVPALTLEAAEPRRAWVPVNGVDQTKITHAVLPGRTNGGKQKTWPQRNLALPRISFVWPHCPPPEIGATLQGLAIRVPSLGRASGHALLSTSVIDAGVDEQERPDWQEWVPTRQDAPDVKFLRTPYQGFLQALRTAHRDWQPAFQQARTVPYRLTGTEAEAEAAGEAVVDGPFADLLTFAFPPGFSLDPSYTLAVTASLRYAVWDRLKAAGFDVSAIQAVNGHKSRDDNRGVLAFLSMPFVGHKHADGRLRGVGLALPHDLDPSLRRVLLDVLLRRDGGLRSLSPSMLRYSLDVSYVSAGSADLGAVMTMRSERWTVPSAQWSTVLPMVLDYFPKRNGAGIEASVAASCRVAGLPEPVSVEVMRCGAFLPGAPDLPAHALRRKSDERPLPGRHVRVRFPRPVRGPVVLGSKRNFGLGLCLPAPGKEDAA